MTTAELLTYYSRLLIIQYLGKTKATAHIKAIVAPVIMDQLPVAVQEAFDIDTAVGVQLNILGKYIGLSRDVYDFNGPVTLTDADYRKILKIKIIQNSSGSSLAEIQRLLFTFFPGQLFVFDYKDMSMSYYFNSSIGSLSLAQIFIKSHLLPRPMGVALKATIYAPVIDKFFGFRDYVNPAMNVTPFNNYTSYDTNAPWLSYANAIV